MESVKDIPSFSSPSPCSEGPVAKSTGLSHFMMSATIRDMDTRKNALLLFSKVPEAGKVKTRLTPIKDGFFDPEVASALYHCMLFDVTECCCDALRGLERADAERYALESTCDYQPLRDTYTLFISSPGVEQEERMRALFEESGTWPRNIVFIHDDGDSFDAHYNDAFDQVWALG